jgi:hypothetical protein
MRVIHKTTTKRDVAQGHIGLQHVFGSQFDATPDHKGMGRVPKCGPEGARKVRFAAPHQSTQICDKHATGDMPVDIVEDLPYLPCQQTLFSVVREPYHRLWIKLSSQQPGCLEYRAVRGLFLLKVTYGSVQQCYNIVHPVTRSALTDLLTGLRFADLSLHADASVRGTVSGPEKDVDRELQWTKSPPIGGLPQHTRSATARSSTNNRWRGP